MLVLNDMTEYLEYDAEKTDKFIDDFSHVLNQHESKAAMLYSVYGRYCHNDTFVGDTATKTKLYIAAHQKFLNDNYELQRAIYKKYCDIASNFSDTVDSSPKARIKMSVLKKVKSDYREMSDTLEYHGRKIMNLAQELQDEFGEFGDFTVPNFHSAICEYDEFCGSSGFLDKCMNNLIEFNEWSSDTVDNSGLYDAEKHMQKKINATVNTLDSMTVYQPDMPKNSIQLVALGANMVPRNIRKKYSGVLSRANSTRTPNKTHKNDIKPEVRILMNQYGYTEEEAKLIDKAITALNTNLGVIKLDNNGDYYIKIANTYGILSELCINYNSTRWRMATGQYNTKQSIEHLKKAGLSDQEILDLRVLINLQHGDYRYSELRAAGIDIDKSTFKNETFTSINARAKTESDFAHTVVQIAAFAHGDDVYKNNRPELGRGIVDYINASANSKLTVTMTRYEISFKGDLDSGRYSEADYRSDLDAINIYERMIKNGDFGMKTWASYYNDVDNDSRHRAVEFLENMGDGHADIGILNTKKVIDEVSLGSEYIQVGNGTDVPKAKKIFMQWLLCTYQGVEYDFPKQE